MVEELLFRGFLSEQLIALSGRAWLGRGMSVVIFAALNAPRFDFMPLGPLALGAVCEMLRWQRLPLIGPIGIHMVANSTVYVWGWWARRIY